MPSSSFENLFYIPVNGAQSVIRVRIDQTQDKVMLYPDFCIPAIELNYNNLAASFVSLMNKYVYQSDNLKTKKHWTDFHENLDEIFEKVVLDNLEYLRSKENEL